MPRSDTNKALIKEPVGCFFSWLRVLFHFACFLYYSLNYGKSRASLLIYAAAASSFFSIASHVCEHYLLSFFSTFTLMRCRANQIFILSRAGHSLLKYSVLTKQPGLFLTIPPGCGKLTDLEKCYSCN